MWTVAIDKGEIYAQKEGKKKVWRGWDLSMDKSGE